MIIHKQNLPSLNTYMTINIPRYAKIIHVGLDSNNIPCLWHQFDAKQQAEIRTILCIGTGIFLKAFTDPKDTIKHLGTFQVRARMYHIFQIGGAS